MTKTTLFATAGLLALIGCSNHSEVVTKDTPVPAPAAASAAPIVVEETPIQKLGKMPSYEGALEYTKPKMEDSVNKLDEGTALLALWSAKSLRWNDVAVAKNETSFAAVLKDPDEARGKRVCVSGSLVQIEVEKTAMGKIFSGLLHDYSGNLYNFQAVRSSGELVARSQARMCGVITGKYDYSNSGGGMGHAINIVGIFDLPENRL